MYGVALRSALAEDDAAGHGAWSVGIQEENGFAGPPSLVFCKVPPKQTAPGSLL